MAETKDERPMVGKTEFVNDLAGKLGKSKKEAGEILNAVFDTIQGYMAEGKGVRLVPFGNFKITTRSAREGKVPGKPEQKVIIPAREVPVFKPGKALKDAVNGLK